MIRAIGKSLFNVLAVTVVIAGLLSGVAVFWTITAPYTAQWVVLGIVFATIGILG